MKIAPATVSGPDLMAQQKHRFPETLPDAAFNDVVDIVSQLCKTSLVCIVAADRKWTKSVDRISAAGIEDCLPLMNDNAALTSEIFVIPELKSDIRFANNKLTTSELSVKSYIGIPLLNTNGLTLGTLCILNRVADTPDESQIRALQALARQIVGLADTAAQLKKKQAEYNMAYTDIGIVAHLASHDLKSPLNNIISLAALLKEDYAPAMDEDGQEYIDYLGDASRYLSDLVSGVLSYTRTAQIPVEQREIVNISAVIEDAIESLDLPEDTQINFAKDDTSIYTSAAALKQIILHMLNSAIRNKSDEPLRIDVAFHEDETSFVMEFNDSGHTVAPEDYVRIFGLFEKLHVKVNKRESLGADLAIAKRLIEKLDGTIVANTEITTGSSYLVTFPKP